MTRLGSPAAGRVLLALLMAGTAALLFHLTRDTTLWFDEWQWVLDREGREPAVFLEPFNGHLSLVPLMVYKVLFATVGIEHYATYRALVIAAHLAVALLVFVYASRRLPTVPALAAAALILFFGPAWANILWPFQVAWLTSLGAGLCALLMLDRGDLRGDLAACALTGLSLACSGLGVPVALGLGVEVVWGRRRLRDVWIVAIPAAVYAVWWLAYQNLEPNSSVRQVPRFVADAAASALSALIGLAGDTVPNQEGTLLTLGRPLLVIALVVLAWRLVRARSIPPRVLTLLTMALSFWILTGLTRGRFGPAAAYASHYRYVGGLFVVLIAVELTRGVAFGRRATAVVAVVVAAAAVSNLGAFRDGAGFLRSQARLTRADLGALDIARPVVAPDFVATQFPGSPLVHLTAGEYFAARDAYGSPAASPAELAGAPEHARTAADAELTAIHAVALREATRDEPLAAGPPVVDRVANGDVVLRGPCVVFRADATSSPATGKMELTVPPGGIMLSAEGEAAAVGVRRFAAGFLPVGGAVASRPATLRIRPDHAARPWHVRLEGARRATACGLP